MAKGSTLIFMMAYAIINIRVEKYKNHYLFSVDMTKHVLLQIVVPAELPEVNINSFKLGSYPNVH